MPAGDETGPFRLGPMTGRGWVTVQVFLPLVMQIHGKG